MQVELADAIWSNFDGVINREIEAQLRKGGCWAKQPAWNYFGIVWFENGQFYENVKSYGVSLGIYSATTVDRLQQIVWSEFGSR
jgi:hypothetical protein